METLLRRACSSTDFASSPSMRKTAAITQSGNRADTVEHLPEKRGRDGGDGDSIERKQALAERGHDERNGSRFVPIPRFGKAPRILGRMTPTAPLVARFRTRSIAAILVAIFLTTLAGCQSAQDTGVMDSKSAAPPMPRFLALGDSYTIGESVAVDDRWPNQLVRELRSHKVNIGDPEIIAKTGWTTDELSRAIDDAKPQRPYELVTLLIGVNNQYRGRDAEQYRGEFLTLLARSVTFAGGRAGHVVVVSIPDWGRTPFAAGRDREKISAEINRYNAINREETLKAGARYADITAISREVATNAALAAPDGLHPSAQMYARWIPKIEAQAAAALR